MSSTMTMAALKELRIAEEQPRQRRHLWPEYRHVTRRTDARFALRSRSHPPHGIAEIIRNEQATDFINRESYRPASRLVV
jgi:7-keto-8-aminopelargonate synthetase-like enzyme